MNESRPGGGSAWHTQRVEPLCARSRADIRYISYTTLYGTPCALVRVLYFRGYSRSKVFGSRIVGTCLMCGEQPRAAALPELELKLAPRALDAGNACGNVVSRERRGCGKERQGDEALAPHTSILMAAWPVDGGPRLHSGYALRTGARRPMSDVRGMRPCGNPLGPGGKECVQRAPRTAIRERAREPRAKTGKRSPTVSKIRTNSDQSKLSHTSQFTVIECPFACPIPYIYVLHPASTTPRISPTMHYALRTHYSTSTSSTTSTTSTATPTSTTHCLQ